MSDKQFLKMADVFCGEVTTKLVDDECINEMARGDGAGNYHVLQDRAYWMLIDKDHAEYAAHAINSHDELVRQRDQLLASLKELLSSKAEPGLFAGVAAAYNAAKLIKSIEDGEWISAGHSPDAAPKLGGE